MTPPLTFAIFRLYVIGFALSVAFYYCLGWSLYWAYKGKTVIFKKEK